MIILVVFSTCSHFGTPPEPPFRVRADPGWAQAGAQECVFPTCVRTPARAPARARALSPTAFAVKGEEEEEEGGSVSSSLSDSLQGVQHPNISKDMLGC